MFKIDRLRSSFVAMCPIVPDGVSLHDCVKICCVVITGSIRRKSSNNLSRYVCILFLYFENGRAYCDRIQFVVRGS